MTTKHARLLAQWKDKASLLRIAQHDEQIARRALRSEEEATKDCYLKASDIGWCGRHGCPMSSCKTRDTNE